MLSIFPENEATNVLWFIPFSSKFYCNNYGTYILIISLLFATSFCSFSFPLTLSICHCSLFLSSFNHSIIIWPIIRSVLPSSSFPCLSHHILFPYLLVPLTYIRAIFSPSSDNSFESPSFCARKHRKMEIQRSSSHSWCMILYRCIIVHGRLYTTIVIPTYKNTNSIDVKLIT